MLSPSRLILMSLAAAGIVLAQTPLPDGMVRGASVEGITEYDLSNGLRVLLFPDATKSTATVNITYLVGSRNENYGETGMAHLLEHMMFKGSTHHMNVMQELTEHGTRPNGTTSYDRTNYFETFEATDQNLGWALDLESDRMVKSFVAKKDLDSEMTVVRNEFESGENSSTNVLLERVMSTAYLWHNYGKATIGARSDIENVPIERLQAFYRLYYQPDNAVLTIAGHIDEAKTLGLVARSFGAIPKPARVLQKTYTEEPAQDGERTVTLRRVGDSKAMIVGVHVPALANPDGAFGDLMADVFTNAPSGRLYKALVATKKCGSVMDETTDSREPGMLLLVAQAPKSADLDDISRTFLSVVDDMQKNPPTAEEVDRGKTKFASQFDLLTRNSERLGLFLSEFIAAGDWRLAFITRDRMAAATMADVDQFARTYLASSNRTIGEFIPTEKPERVEVAAAPDINSLVKDYKGGTAIAQGEAFDASPSNIDKRTIRGQLQPGIELGLLPKKTRGSVVNATLRLHFGNENSLQGKDVIASLTGAMLMRGTSKHSREQITDQFNKLKAQVRISGTAVGAIATVQTTRENLPAVMQLIAEVLRESSFPETEFESLKQQRITMLENERREPQAIAFQQAERHLNPYPKGDVRYVLSPEEEIADIQAAKLDDIKSFYQQFYGASHAELSVVGDFDAEQMQKQTSSLYQGWASKDRYVRVASNYRAVPAVDRTFETPDKANAVFIAVQPVKMDDANPEYPALLLSNYMLGGGFLNSRLATRIRVKDGLSYGIGSQLSVPIKEDQATFLTYAISAPQNTAKVESDFREEMKRALDAGFTDQEIAAAKSGWLQSRQVSRGQDAELAVRLASHAQWGRTMQWEAGIENKVSALTAAEINSAFRKYIDLSKISVMKAGDFAKAKASQPPAASGASVKQ